MNYNTQNSKKTNKHLYIKLLHTKTNQSIVLYKNTSYKIVINKTFLLSFYIFLMI